MHTPAIKLLPPGDHCAIIPNNALCTWNFNFRWTLLAYYSVNGQLWRKFPWITPSRSSTGTTIISPTMNNGELQCILLCFYQKTFARMRTLCCISFIFWVDNGWVKHGGQCFSCYIFWRKTINHFSLKVLWRYEVIDILQYFDYKGYLL